MKKRECCSLMMLDDCRPNYQYTDHYKRTAQNGGKRRAIIRREASTVDTPCPVEDSLQSLKTFQRVLDEVDRQSTRSVRFND